LSDQLTIGIGGVSRAGKSTLASLLETYLEDRYSKVKIICQDDFVVEEKSMPIIDGQLDWDHPDSIDWDRLLKAVQKAKNSFDLVIVEGIFTFYKQELAQLYDLNLFLTIRKETFMERRREEERWGEEEDWYLKHVWQSYLTYGLPSVPVIELEGSNMWVMDNVIEKIGLASTS
jgi:uridine kinase